MHSFNSLQIRRLEVVAASLLFMMVIMAVIVIFSFVSPFAALDTYVLYGHALIAVATLLGYLVWPTLIMSIRYFGVGALVGCDFVHRCDFQIRTRTRRTQDTRTHATQHTNTPAACRINLTNDRVLPLLSGTDWTLHGLRNAAVDEEEAQRLGACVGC